ncbi:MAG: undecaprenyl-diphosphate phosphatase [Synechococcus sp. SB0676_bin_10]|uniref:Undecaprenyl-diphosphatase n=1 Tax=Synechococcus sp. SB0676_bin_10 TaxID=2604869 RepID=A0A6B1F9P9_9SYNE|nr:undecaprenyl-diphosphate phosphatase [Synechococcus sp. SB0664_bin_36]MYG38947.1 undecaprenyl-diphosphate phosphatase [Synechococcus sp. SB0676_bin_10]MYK07198.1 undecaprenyl-diphosphate phosphatase [Synechococcus sp. SB0670_bin_20]
MDGAPGLALACWRALVLGIVQGLTEFFPISSTAHLKAVPVLLGWGDPGVAVTAVLQLGSIVAVLAYFREDLRQLSLGLLRGLRYGRLDAPEARLGLAIVVGTVPILVAGLTIRLFFYEAYGASALRSLAGIGVVSIAMAALLALAERLGRRRHNLEQVSVRAGWLMGLAQTLALAPGVSRSGSTLTAALLMGWQRVAAARFSFLLGIPAITMAGLAELKEAITSPSLGGALPLLVGLLSAALSSWLAIAWLLRFLQQHSTWVFVLYRLGFGVLLLLVSVGGSGG